MNKNFSNANQQLTLNYHSNNGVYGQISHQFHGTSNLLAATAIAEAEQDALAYKEW